VINPYSFFSKIVNARIKFQKNEKKEERRKKKEERRTQKAVAEGRSQRT
jgi:hypothetical protein